MDNLLVELSPYKIVIVFISLRRSSFFIGVIALLTLLMIII